MLSTLRIKIFGQKRTFLRIKSAMFKLFAMHGTVGDLHVRHKLKRERSEVMILFYNPSMCFTCVV